MTKRLDQAGMVLFGLMLLGVFALLIGVFPSQASVEAQAPSESTTPRPDLYLPIILRPLNTVTPIPTPVPTPKPIGPFGGTFTAIVVDPMRPEIVYAGSYTNGVYKSIDRGLTWYRMVNGLGNLSIQSLAIDPTDSNVVYAGTYSGGLYKSTNGAGSWLKVGNVSFGDHIVYHIAIDRTNPSIILITTRTKTRKTIDPLLGHLWRSADRGNTWQLLRLGNDYDTPDYFYDVSIHPTNGKRVFLSYHQHGFFRSDDGGFTFTAFNQGATDLTARSVAYDSMVNNLVYAGTWNSPSAYRSDDAGRNWVPIQPKNVINEVKTMKVLLVPFGSSYKQVLLATRDNGILSSVDRGSSWSRKGPGEIFINDIGVADSAYQYWFAAAQDLGVYRSVNAGSTWTNSRNNFTNVTITGSVKYTELPGTILVSTIGQGVLLYDGENWGDFNHGLGNENVTNLISDGKKTFATTTEGLYELVDGTWQPISLPVSQLSTADMYIDELSEQTLIQEDLLLEAAHENTLSIDASDNPEYPISLLSFAQINGSHYGGTAGMGLWCGDGRTWSHCGFVGEDVVKLKPLSDGIGIGAIVCDSSQICRLEINRGTGWDEVKLSSSYGKINDFMEINGTFWLGSENGLYRLIAGNGILRMPQITGEVFSITENDTKTCIAAAAGIGTVYTSTDCGTSWKQTAIGETNEEIRVIMPDPQLIGDWFAGSMRTGVYRFSPDD